MSKLQRCVEWMKFLIRERLKHMHLGGTDCAQLFQCWENKEAIGRSLFHGLLEDCRKLLHNSPFKFLVFTKRAGNNAAHSVTTLAFSFYDSCWIEEHRFVEF